MVVLTEWMSAVPNHRASEVFIWDTDALLGDACDTLAGPGRGRSEVLAAIDAGILVALMSEQAYVELGWMYPKAARGRSVDEDSLREVIEKEYLPRARVVTLPTRLDAAWAPLIEDVNDADDIQHAQLARLVAPSSVYSHDRHLRRPGYAPADRAAYREVLEIVAILTHFREATVGAAMGANLTLVVATGAVKGAAGRLRVKPSLIALSGIVVTAAVVAVVVRDPARRRLVRHAAATLADAIGAAAMRDTEAGLKLAATSVVPVDPYPRIEAQVAAVLARNPDVTVTALSDRLGSNAPAEPDLRLLLQSHPAFVATRPDHWALGSVRTALVN
ncbi:MAG TPA: hypothetical protein VGK32_08640 [Vicinamibacterales bacterium]|jgi:hypothetical protein